MLRDDDRHGFVVFVCGLRPRMAASAARSRSLVLRAGSPRTAPVLAAFRGSGVKVSRIRTYQAQTSSTRAAPPVATSPTRKAPLAPTSVSVERSTGTPVMSAMSWSQMGLAAPAAADPQLGGCGSGGDQAVADDQGEPFHHGAGDVLAAVLERQARRTCPRPAVRGTAPAPRPARGRAGTPGRRRPAGADGQLAELRRDRRDPSSAHAHWMTSPPANVGNARRYLPGQARARR